MADASGRRARVLMAAAFNAIPVLGVLIWGWSGAALLFLYWIENLAIGVRTAAAMIASGVARADIGAPGVVAFTAFFCVHYGLFCLGHGVFLAVLFAGEARAAAAGLFDLSGVVRALFASEADLAVGAGAIALWQALLFALFLARGEAGATTPLALMGSPYPRILILHATILAGGLALLALGMPQAGVVTLALVKTAFDAGLVWFGERREAAGGS